MTESDQTALPASAAEASDSLHVPRLESPIVVGIGTSAGGLEALELFLANVPAGSGMAYVIVQHLDPTHKAMLAELLQRATPMPVLEAENRMRVKPDCVYVIPPNKDMALMHGLLLLLEPAAPRGLRLPIDFFFRSLAEDQRELAIGVILSGMGSDGTLGLRAIQGKGGLCVVQDPATAKFDLMPRSAVEAGLADVVAPAVQLPMKIIAFLQHIKPVIQLETVPTTDHEQLERIMVLIRDRTSNEFSLYKKNTVFRRVERRMGLHQIGTMAQYVNYLRSNPQEIDLLFKELLIGVTNFFRDPEVWEHLRNDAIPALLARHPAGKILRAWVPACSTGEEAYSLAMVFKEALEQLKPTVRFSLQIFATDLDQDAIERARAGRYPASIAADVSPERLNRYFVVEDSGYRIGKEIREMVIFAPQNIIMDPPFTKLDILTCRNLLIYLGAELQVKLIPLFHYALNRDGVLVLGSAETIGNFISLFTPLDNKARIYQRLDHPSKLASVDFPTKIFPVVPLATMPEERKHPVPAGSLQFHADQFLLQHFSPPAVLVNQEGDILYINGRTGVYLEPAAGKANWNIYAMARDGLRHPLASALKKVIHQQGRLSVDNLQVADRNGALQCVNVVLQMLDKPDMLRGLIMIVFAEVALPAPQAAAHDGEVPQPHLLELERAREEIQALREDMQTSQEELTSTNEELQSTNEELQSTNEELTTSKEEMQSLNEELHSVNAELQSKVDDLTWANNDMKNLLNSMDIATVFLDNALHIRRFTTQAKQVFKLIGADIGRPLSDISTDLAYPELQDDAREVLNTLVFSDKQIATHDGRWFKVRIMPYRTFDNVIDGVVITFSDITATQLLEQKLRSTQQAPST